MIRVNNISVPLDFDFADLRGLCTGKLRIRPEKLHSVKLAKKSVDARKKSDVHFITSLDIEAEGEQKLLKGLKNAVKAEQFEYPLPRTEKPEKRPVIVGFGPAGMFAALVLAMAGAEPIVLERGGDVDSRCRAVEEFRSTGRLDTECNIQFGEGGAGTFSDGKLTTGIKDKRIGWVLERLVEFGAPEEILVLAKPHIGTDMLRDVVKNLRERVISLGGEVRFGARFCGFSTDNGHISSAEYEQEGKRFSISTDNVILATGHSARDVFELMYSRDISLSQKNFAVGVRIEHRREDIDKAMYGDFAGHPALKAADYKLAVHLPNGRTLYTFCMCPGGEVVAASSEEGRLAVNGMSCFARNAENSNSALLVNIDTSDYGSQHPLAGMWFQRKLEEKAFAA
ncbi:MAG: FAD-dependent oxidoreductase, partial [Ruminococcus sp.]|nr:FAD-dependent oxidoreductase [Ruminococcus sp.]